ncbi:MAG TPA: GNAT family N-acetyltransferase [Pseudonocardiaceae bacterium]
MTAERVERAGRVVRLELTDALVARVVEVQRAAYAVEAALIGFDGIPALHEGPDDVRASGEEFLGWHDEGGVLAGVLGWRRLPDGAVDICRLVVSPERHRRGVATALLDALDEVAPADRTVVSTATANGPALALYERRGFRRVDTREIAPGVTITLLERR